MCSNLGNRTLAESLFIVQFYNVHDQVLNLELTGPFLCLHGIAWVCLLSWVLPSQATFCDRRWHAVWLTSWAVWSSGHLLWTVCIRHLWANAVSSLHAWRQKSKQKTRDHNVRSVWRQETVCRQNDISSWWQIFFPVGQPCNHIETYSRQLQPCAHLVNVSVMSIHVSFSAQTQDQRYERACSYLTSTSVTWFCRGTGLIELDGAPACRIFCLFHCLVFDLYICCIRLLYRRTVRLTHVTPKRGLTSTSPTTCVILTNRRLQPETHYFLTLCSGLPNTLYFHCCSGTWLCTVASPGSKYTQPGSDGFSSCVVFCTSGRFQRPELDS